MKQRMDLRMDSSPVVVEIDGGVLRIDGDELVPEKASKDSFTPLPMYVPVMAVIGTIVVGTIAGGGLMRVKGMEWAAIAIIFPVTVLAVMFEWKLMTARKEAVIAQFNGKERTFTGRQEDLDSLHYQLSKMRIVGMEASGRDTVGSRAGTSRGSEVMPDEERRSLEMDMKRSIGRRKVLKGKICPQCGSNQLYYEAGLLAGYQYHCKECDYIGAFVIEKELEV